jgi:hypothetical protein
LRAFDLPIVVGPSRKSFLKKEGELDTEFATAAAVTAAILSGAHIVRVHDVKAMKVVAEITDVIQQARERDEEEQRENAAPPRPAIRRPERSNGEEPIKRLRPRLKDAPPHQGR